MENPESKPPRRIRYKGTHPKSFKEKYKELQPEKYAEDVEKIIQKGYTPAGMHRSICVNEILEVLKITPGQIGLDATLGYGGQDVKDASGKVVIPANSTLIFDIKLVKVAAAAPAAAGTKKP